MLKNLNTKNTALCVIAVVIALCGLIALIIAFKNAGNVPQNQFTNLQPSSMLGDEKNKVSFKGVDQKLAIKQQLEIESVEQKECSSQCQATLSALDKSTVIDDETFHKLGALAKTIAAYLHENDNKRKHYFEMALTTTDDDRRSFLTDVFKYLPAQQKQEIGDGFVVSENWHTRSMGVALITDGDTSDSNTVKKLTAILSIENNSYVKNTIINHLKQDDSLQGDLNVLSQLDLILNNSSDSSSTRVAALKAKLQLSDQPYFIIPDAVQALHTNEPELQFAGLIMIDRVLQEEDKYIEDGVYIDKKTIKDAIQGLRNTSSQGVEDKGLAGLIREADALYLRYFEH